MHTPKVPRLLLAPSPFMRAGATEGEVIPTPCGRGWPLVVVAGVAMDLGLGPTSDSDVRGQTLTHFRLM
jgi:hypothetical protein